MAKLRWRCSNWRVWLHIIFHTLQARRPSFPMHPATFASRLVIALARKKDRARSEGRGNAFPAGQSGARVCKPLRCISPLYHSRDRRRVFRRRDGNSSGSRGINLLIPRLDCGRSSGAHCSARVDPQRGFRVARSPSKSRACHRPFHLFTARFRSTGAISDDTLAKGITEVDGAAPREEAFFSGGVK